MPTPLSEDSGAPVVVDVGRLRADLDEALARIADLEARNAELQRALAKRGRRLEEARAQLRALGA